MLKDLKPANVFSRTFQRCHTSAQFLKVRTSFWWSAKDALEWTDHLEVTYFQDQGFFSQIQSCWTTSYKVRHVIYSLNQLQYQKSGMTGMTERDTSGWWTLSIFANHLESRWTGLWQCLMHCTAQNSEMTENHSGYPNTDCGVLLAYLTVLDDWTGRFN